MFACEFCKISKNTFLQRTLLVAASVRFTKAFIIWTKQAFSGIWEVLSYSITWIPWRSILVNINFYIIQFPLISVFLDKKMKIYLLDIFLFLLFEKTIPQKASKVLLEFNGKILIDLLSFGSLWNTLLGETLPEKIFDAEKWGNFVKIFITFPRQCFSQLIFWYFQLRLKCIRWNSNENEVLYEL